VRETLPNRGTVGYVLKVRSPEMLDWYQHYGLVFAQYTLAPLQVEVPKLFRVPSKTESGDLGLLCNLGFGIWDLLSSYDVVIEDYDEGVRIIRRPTW
jgi:hypothetical protein